MAQMLKIDGREYDLEDLSQETRSQIGSLQYADRRIKETQDELALTQTAINAYAVNLGRKMPKEARANRKKNTVTINDKKYLIDDFDENSKGLVFSIHKAQKKQLQLKADLALYQTARAAYAKGLNETLHPAA
ncbi:MAG: DUF6447 family protein [Desulfuromonas sp.]|nr:DUF6447 family protein [Desulfuromonas sp.]